MKKFEILDFSGDVGLRVFGDNLCELFVNAAVGMSSLIADLSGIKKRKTVSVNLESQSLESLFVSWLNEFVFHFDTYGFIGQEIRVVASNVDSVHAEGTEKYRISATASGEDFDPERHEAKLLIKAATYHKLKIERAGNRWTAEVIFDI